MNKKLSNNLIKIVNILHDGEYHDGDSLGVALKMTRSAVWKLIKKLQHYGIAIDSVKGKGYALQEPLVLLDATKIKKQLAAEKLDLCVYESISTTMDYLHPIENVNAIKVVLAEQQTQGRGRFNREWYSPFAKNINFSCHYPLHKDISELAGLSLVASLAVLATINSFGIETGLHTKWPNDIVYENKKLSGSLIEMQAQSHGQCHVTIGVGINVNMLDDQHEITQPWISMQQILGEYIDRNELCVRMLTNLIAYLSRFEKQGFHEFMDEWMQADYLSDKIIKLKNVNSIIQGKVAGVNERGNILLKLPDGNVRAFAAGDTTVVK